MRFALIALPLVLCASVPEKMQLANIPRHDLGGVIIASDNRISENYNISPIMYYGKDNKPYKYQKYQLNSSGEDVKVDLVVLEPGIYRINKISFSNGAFPLVTQNNLSSYFKVKKNKILYIGRINLSMSINGTTFKYNIVDKYTQDVAKFAEKRASGIEVQKCLISMSDNIECGDEV